MGDPEALAVEALDAINRLAGRHAGRRALHARGCVLTATFTATPQARELSRAPFLGGTPAPAIVRFSNGTGRPDQPDAAPDGRGMAVKLTLADGSKVDLLGTTLPVFAVRTPEDFVELTRAREPDPTTGGPDMAKVGAFIADHPEALPALQATLGFQPPESWATVRYNGIHALRYVNADGVGRFGRLSFVPDAGEVSLDPSVADQLEADYLEQEIIARMAAGPVSFSLVVTLAEAGDPVDDPSAPWPDERERVVVGSLRLDGLDSTRERDGDVLVFDPTRVCDGLELSDDPILHFRSLAYRESVARRTEV